MDLDAKIKMMLESFGEAGKNVKQLQLNIGELLIDKKASLKHGEFCSWISANLPFSHATAWNYMCLAKEAE